MKRVFGCGVVGLVLIALFLGTLAWAVRSHARLSAAERAVDRAWTEMEVAYRQRAEAVPGLLDSLRHGNVVAPGALGRLREARERAFEILPTPELVTDAGEFERFLSLQGALTDAIDEVLAPARDRVEEPSLSEAVGRVETIEARLEAGAVAFDTEALAYNRLLTRPPHSWIGRIAGFRAAVLFGRAG